MINRILKNIGWFLLYLLIGFISIFPILWGLKLSLSPKYTIGLWPEHFTVQAYKDILTNPALYTYFWNSLKISLGAIVIIIPMALLAAYGLARFKFRGSKLISLALLALPMLPSSAILVSLIRIFNNIGLYDRLEGVVLVAAVFNVAMSVWMLRNFIDNTPKTIEEAAALDGLSPIATLFRITLPMIKPGLLSVVIYIFVNTWNNYTYSFALVTSQENKVLSQAILNFIGSWGTNWAGLTAMGIIMLLPPILFFLCFQKAFIAGMFGETLK